MCFQIKKWLLISLLWSAPFVFANSLAELEKKLSSIEYRTEKFLSGQKKMTQGFAELVPNIRKIACEAYPTESSKKTIKDLKREIGFLEKKKNIAQMNSAQIDRLLTQKNIVANLTPDINCATPP